jgi:hypothetical protein
VENNLDKIEHLMGLFDHRQKLWTASTRKIASFVNDTLLKALQELLGLPDEALVWDEFLLVDNIVALKFSISYNPSEPMTRFLELVSLTNPAEPVVLIQRTLQIGVPLATIFLPREEVKGWLTKMAEDTFGATKSAEQPKTDEADAPASAEPAPGTFDPTQLTPDQVKQLLYFQQLTKGVKQ